jgi:hypothetical protein
MLKNKKILIPLIAVIVLILIGGGIYLFVSRNNASQTPTPIGEQMEVFPTIMPDDIGLEIQVKSDKKYVKFTINKPDGIEKVEYEIVYNAIMDGNELSQALIGDLAKADIKDGKLSIEYRELGTCSTGGKCRFDTGITWVKVVLKITKSDGKIYQAEQKIDL